jgi:hypothetical protein
LHFPTPARLDLFEILLSDLSDVFSIPAQPDVSVALHRPKQPGGWMVLEGKARDARTNGCWLLSGAALSKENKSFSCRTRQALAFPSAAALSVIDRA